MRWSAHISWLYRELPYLERPGAARHAGFAAIESAWPEHAAERAGLAQAVSAAGVGVALLNAPAGDLAGGERGFANDPGRRAEAEAGFRDAAALAAAIGAPLLNVLVGRELPGVPLAVQRATLLDALRGFAAIAAEAGVGIALEPLNDLDSPGFLAPTPDAVAELIAELGDARIGLLLDVYHLARAGHDAFAAIARHRDLIRHVQISEAPGRGVPGTGSLDLVELLDALAGVGYDGAVGLEYDPGGDTTASLGFLRGLPAAMLRPYPRPHSRAPDRRAR